MSWGKVMEEIRWRGARCVVATCMLAALAAAPARAADDRAKASPRTTADIGGASVVLVAANDRLYAFVDRIEGNAPVGDARLGIGLADGSSLKLATVSEGMFTAPYNHGNRVRETFVVTLASADGSGEARPEITYDDVVVAEAPPALPGSAGLKLNVTFLQMLLVLGAALAVTVLAVARARWRRPAAVAGVADVA